MNFCVHYFLWFWSSIQPGRVSIHECVISIIAIIQKWPIKININCRSVASEASEGTTPNNETIQPTFFTTFLGAEFAQNLDARRQFCVF